MTTPLVAALYARTSHKKDDAFSLSLQLPGLRQNACGLCALATFDVNSATVALLDLQRV